MRQSTHCVWSSGLIANRATLLAELDLTPRVSDPELAAALASRHGAEGAARRIAGSFSFVLWRSETSRLTAIRGRLGADDLCWREEAGGVILGAVRSLVRLGPEYVDLDPVGLAGHLAGTGAPPGRTMFRGVARLEPGELVEISPGTWTRCRYWRADLRPVLKLASPGDYAELLRDLLLKVAAGYRSDRPSGITLSSGLDSTSLAWALRAGDPLARPRALLWTSPEVPEADETVPARAVCRRLDMACDEIRADLHWPLSGGAPAGTSAEPELTVFPEIWEATLAAARSRGLEVVYTGASGDNLFGGEVSSYPDLLLGLRWAELARQLRSHLQWSELGAIRVLRLFVLTPMRRCWFGAGRPRPPSWLTARGRNAAREALTATRTERRLFPGRWQLQVQLGERLQGLAVNQLGHRAARHGIELRHPLLDHRLIDFAASLPSDQLFHAGERKFILRNAMRGNLPDEVVMRRRKIIPRRLFELGVGDRGRAVVADLLTGMRAADLGLIEPDRLRQGFESFVAGTSRDTRFWQALTLEAWLRAYH